MDRRLAHFRLVWISAALLLTAGCERGPLPELCTPLGAGDLAVSELRGKQTGADTFGQWIELYNASAASIPLTGVTLRLRLLDGSRQADIVLRGEGLALAPGDYFVAGRFPPDDLPRHVDYGYEQDFSSDMYIDGLLEVFACGQQVDRLVYRNLPNEGSLSFDGAQLPDATANDVETDWCTDRTPYEPGDGGTTEVGLPGTPGEANHPCP